ncbi:modification methylase HemK [Thalassospira profundimaris]|uniref:Release factor glutamine methyltransferase n=1 Tax=Thalassospira profundimaris TaxID=502049 RepID=A0A367XDC9_9PROT|nr:peptide chain release factor N(5)-glutamine methyltransferase [Thalassospira profundimaris]RCK51634.1 modification methylase HemK [Thalassospira profundimaris]
MTSDQPENTPATLGNLMAWAVAMLRDAGNDTARLDAKILLCEASGVDTSRILAWPDDVVSPEKVDLFRAMIARRLAHEPVSRILGRRDFWRHTFKVTKDTLDPRPDSETLVEWAIECARRFDSPKMIDFGTGTGCLVLSVLGDVPKAFGLGVDISAGAVACALENARNLGLAARCDFVVSDWMENLPPETIASGFDMMISNPPYIAHSEMVALAPDVRDYDPYGALSDGGDGLGAYRILADVAARLVRPGGQVIFEIGQGQEKAVRALLTQHGFDAITERRDLGGIVRCVGGQKQQNT